MSKISELKHHLQEEQSVHLPGDADQDGRSKEMLHLPLSFHRKQKNVEMQKQQQQKMYL